MMPVLVTGCIGRRIVLALRDDDLPVVSDRAQETVATPRYIESGGGGAVLHGGDGRGYSVAAVVRTTERGIGRPNPLRAKPCRVGGRPSVVACNDRIRAVLGSGPQHDDMDGVVASVRAWERRMAVPPCLPGRTASPNLRRIRHGQAPRDDRPL